MPIIYNIYNKYVDEIIYISKFYCNDLSNPKNRYLVLQNIIILI